MQDELKMEELVTLFRKHFVAEVMRLTAGTDMPLNEVASTNLIGLVGKQIIEEANK